METYTKIFIFSIVLIIIVLVILIFTLIKLRADNISTLSKSSSEENNKFVLSEFLNSSNLMKTFTKADERNKNLPENKHPKKRNVLEILAINLHNFLKNSISVTFNNVYRRLFNTKLQGFIQYEDGILKFSKDRNAFSKVMINSDGQIILGRDLDKCLERRMLDSTGVSEVVVSVISPVTQSKKWKLKNGTILDPTENFCLGVLDDKIKLFSVIFVTEKGLTEHIDKWSLIK
jgi:hypothetical protein